MAAYLTKHAGPTLLVDADPNRQSSFWASFGLLPFAVANELEAVRMAAGFEHLVFDTKVRVERQEVDSINRASDLIVILCPADSLAAHAALQMTEALAAMGSAKYRVLMTMVAHDSYREQCEGGHHSSLRTRILRNPSKTRTARRTFNSNWPPVKPYPFNSTCRQSSGGTTWN